MDSKQYTFVLMKEIKLSCMQYPKYCYYGDEEAIIEKAFEDIMNDISDGDKYRNGEFDKQFIDELRQKFTKDREIPTNKYTTYELIKVECQEIRSLVKSAR